MKKVFVLDTNVLLTDPNALYSFSNNDIVLPFKVLEELDKKKGLQDVVGSNARHIIRELDNLRNKGSLSKGVRIDKGLGMIYVKEANINLLPQDFEFAKTDTPDNRIIAVAFMEKQLNPDRKVIIVSRDINVRIKSDSLGLIAEGYELDKSIEKRENLYSGFTTILVDDNAVDRFYNGESIYIEKEEKKLFCNQFVMLKSNSNENKTALAKFINYSTSLKKVLEYKNGIWGVIPRNKEQSFAFNLLMDSNIEIMTLTGAAGTGKTLVTIAAALEQLLGKKETQYKKLLISKPMLPVGGRDIGYLPGSKDEKILPWMSAISDNLEFLFGNDKNTLQDYMDRGIIELECLSFIRGRSISNAIIIFDECQNMNLNEIKTLVTRVGENTKIILIGDIQQIDSIYLNEFTNGLTHAIEKFKGENIYGHVALVRGERSKVASLAAKIL